MAYVLFIRGGAIGDFILTLPILDAILSDDPEANIEVLGYPAIAEIAVGRRLAVAAWNVGSGEWAPLFSTQSEFAPTEQEYLRLFDRICCVWPDGRGVIVSNLNRAGAQNVMHVNPIPPPDCREHVIKYMARQCGAAGLELKHMDPHLYPSPRDRWWAEGYMRVTGAGHRPLLGIHPGSGSALKNWPTERFADVARDWIRRRKGHVFIVAGTADDKPLSVLRTSLDEDKTFVFRNEPLPRVAAVLERCAAFVGNDSGIAHMAAAVRTPSVVIFGPADPRIWRPLGPRVDVVSAVESGGALADVATDTVIERIERVLGGET